MSSSFIDDFSSSTYAAVHTNRILVENTISAASDDSSLRSIWKTNDKGLRFTTLENTRKGNSFAFLDINNNNEPGDLNMPFIIVIRGEDVPTEDMEPSNNDIICRQKSEEIVEPTKIDDIVLEKKEKEETDKKAKKKY